MRPITFAPDEWFHCYTRGVDKRIIFMDERDAQRFQMLLHAANGTKRVHLSNFPSKNNQGNQGPALMDVLDSPRGTPLVDIAAYCLMPNHVHLLLRELDYGGVSTFMQKLGTGYTMYFNKKYERTGALFSGRFKAAHVYADSHSRRIINYIHANPAELYESCWKKGIVRDEEKLKKSLLAYQFSSLPDYSGIRRPENILINRTAAAELMDATPSFKTLLNDARVFYRREKEILDELE